MIKAIIFDMDGLLIDSEPFWQEAEAATLNEIGVPLTKEMVKKTMGFRVDQVVEYWFSRYPWSNPGKKEVEDKIMERVINLVKSKGAAKEGVREILDFFHGRNIPMAVASSSHLKVINSVLDKISIEKYFKFAYSAENEIYGKPHPGVFLTAAKKLEVEPEFCLAFEDSPAGVMAAKAARMKCIAVPDESMRGNKIFSIADMVIPSLKEFPLEYLDGEK